MNTELILTVLSLLGDIQMPSSTTTELAHLNATYASWMMPVTVEYQCPDNSGIDPMGQPLVVGKSIKTTDGSTAFVAIPLVAYPTSKICQKDVMEPHHSIFPSMLDAGEFRLHCDDGKCLDWHARQATEEEVCDYALAQRKWKVDHYPGGDPSKYPNGIYEIWPRDERRVETALGTGSSELAAIINALQGKRP